MLQGGAENNGPSRPPAGATPKTLNADICLNVLEKQL
jgi:hypothetical protein